MAIAVSARLEPEFTVGQYLSGVRPEMPLPRFLCRCRDCVIHREASLFAAHGVAVLEPPTAVIADMGGDDRALRMDGSC